MRMTLLATLCFCATAATAQMPSDMTQGEAQVLIEMGVRYPELPTCKEAEGRRGLKKLNETLIQAGKPTYKCWRCKGDAEPRCKVPYADSDMLPPRSAPRSIPQNWQEQGI